MNDLYRIYTDVMQLTTLLCRQQLPVWKHTWYFYHTITTWLYENLFTFFGFTAAVAIFRLWWRLIITATVIPTRFFDCTKWKNTQELSLMGKNILGIIFFQFWLGRQLLWLPIHYPVHQDSLEKGSITKGKNLLFRRKFFPFRVDPIVKEEKSVPSELSPMLVYPSHTHFAL